MKIKTFIDRPLLSIVISVMMVALGFISLSRLPIEKYPDIAPPTIYLWASYPGASAETVQKSVLAPLEQAINGVDNMTYMTSSASNGMASISIYFKQGTNSDMAAVNVQNRVVQAQAMLPAEVLRFGVSVENANRASCVYWHWRAQTEPTTRTSSVTTSTTICAPPFFVSRVSVR